MIKKTAIVPIKTLKDLKDEFGDIEGMLTYMHSRLNCDIKLKGDKVQLEYPNSYEWLIKSSSETIKAIVKRWKQTYIDKLLRMQYTMSKKYEESVHNGSLAWEKDMVSDTMHFHYIESILINDFDYGSHCLYGEGERCPEEAVMNCYYCSLHTDWKSIYSLADTDEEELDE